MAVCVCRIASSAAMSTWPVVPDDRFRSKPLFPAHSVAVMSRKHPLSRRRALDVAELADKPLLLLNRTFGSREWFDSACSVARIRPRVLLESAAPHTLVALAGMGYGIAIVPSNVALPGGVHAPPWFSAERRSEGG